MSAIDVHYMQDMLMHNACNGGLDESSAVMFGEKLSDEKWAVILTCTDTQITSEQ